MFRRRRRGRSHSEVSITERDREAAPRRCLPAAFINLFDVAAKPATPGGVGRTILCMREFRRTRTVRSVGVWGRAAPVLALAVFIAANGGGGGVAAGASIDLADAQKLFNSGKYTESVAA